MKNSSDPSGIEPALVAQCLNQLRHLLQLMQVLVYRYFC